jgi:hypothetical protein
MTTSGRSTAHDERDHYLVDLLFVMGVVLALCGAVVGARMIFSDVDRVPASIGFGLVIVSMLLGILVAMTHRIARGEA